MNTRSGNRRTSKGTVKRQLGTRIIQARQSRGWSQAELARRLEVPRDRLGKWERGLCAPGVDDLVTLSEVLGVPFAELVQGRREEEGITVTALESLARDVLSMARTLKPWVDFAAVPKERRVGRRG
jgi:transcriptional regulator with XRE-family HTH domain